MVLLLLLMMVMTVVQGCTAVVAVGVTSGYRRGVTLERNSVGNDGVTAAAAAGVASAA